MSYPYGTPASSEAEIIEDDFTCPACDEDRFGTFTRTRDSEGYTDEIVCPVCDHEFEVEVSYGPFDFADC